MGLTWNEEEKNAFSCWTWPDVMVKLLENMYNNCKGPYATENEFPGTAKEQYIADSGYESFIDSDDDYDFNKMIIHGKHLIPHYKKYDDKLNIRANEELAKEKERIEKDADAIARSELDELTDEDIKASDEYKTLKAEIEAKKAAEEAKKIAKEKLSSKKAAKIIDNLGNLGKIDEVDEELEEKEDIDTEEKVAEIEEKIGGLDKIDEASEELEDIDIAEERTEQENAAKEREEEARILAEAKNKILENKKTDLKKSITQETRQEIMSSFKKDATVKYGADFDDGSWIRKDACIYVMSHALDRNSQMEQDRFDYALSMIAVSDMNYAKKIVAQINEEIKNQESEIKNYIDLDKALEKCFSAAFPGLIEKDDNAGKQLNQESELVKFLGNFGEKSVPDAIKNDFESTPGEDDEVDIDRFKELLNILVETDSRFHKNSQDYKNILKEVNAIKRMFEYDDPVKMELFERAKTRMVLVTGDYLKSHAEKGNTDFGKKRMKAVMDMFAFSDERKLFADDVKAEYGDNNKNAAKLYEAYRARDKEVEMNIIYNRDLQVEDLANKAIEFEQARTFKFSSKMLAGYRVFRMIGNREKGTEVIIKNGCVKEGKVDKLIKEVYKSPQMKAIEERYKGMEVSLSIVDEDFNKLLYGEISIDKYRQNTRKKNFVAITEEDLEAKQELMREDSYDSDVKIIPKADINIDNASEDEDVKPSKKNYVQEEDNLDDSFVSLN